VLAAVGIAVAGVAGAAGAAALARRPDGRMLLVALGGAELMMLAASAARYRPFVPTRTNLFVVPMIVIVLMVGAERVIWWLAAVVGGRHAVREPQRAAEGSTGVSPTRTMPGAVNTRSLSGFSGGSRTDGDHTDARFRVVVGSPAAVDGASRSRARATVAVPLVAIVALSGCGGLLLATSLSGSRSLWDHRVRMRGLDLMIDMAVATRMMAHPGDVVAVGGRLARPGWLYAMEASDDRPRDPAGFPPIREDLRPRVGTR
jgi:hypothetical protein